MRAFLRLGFLVLLASASSCGGSGGSDRAAVEQAVRQYFQGISSGDGSLLCERIDPHFGFFTSEGNCLEVETYLLQRGGLVGPHYSADEPFVPRPEVIGLEDASVSGDTAAVAATVRWSAEHKGQRRSFGEAKLSMRLVHSDGSWRVTSFENAAVPPSSSPDIEAVTQAVLDYYQALGQAVGHDSGTGFWSSTPTNLGEHRERYVLSAVAGVKFKDAYAAATIVVHDIDNGAIGRPDPFDLVLGRDGRGWHVVAPTDPAYALFE
jgi:hypothetical protein